jgi:Sec-independent protein translocase protein TatA
VLLLSPPKLLMILVIALIVLGPDKLPSAARRIGAAWSDFTRWRAHLESEVRATFPDLPSTSEIARAVRSPITVLDRLAEEHGSSTVEGEPAAPQGARRDAPPSAGPNPNHPDPGTQASVGPDVSSMN